MFKTPQKIFVCLFLMVFCLQLLAFLFIPQLVSAAGCSVPRNAIRISVEIPGLTRGTPGSSCYWVQDLPSYINALYKFTIAAAGIIAAVMIMIGGVIWLMAGGDSGKITKAKEFIMNAVVGLILLLLAYTLLSTISPKLIELQMPGLAINVNATPCAWSIRAPSPDYYQGSNENCSGRPLPNQVCFCRRVELQSR